MSVVTGVALIVSLGQEDCVSQAQTWLGERNRGRMREVADSAGGGKHPQFEIWAAGINNFHDEDEFARFVLSLPWPEPENVVLVLQPEEGSTRVLHAVRQAR